MPLFTCFKVPYLSFPPYKTKQFEGSRAPLLPRPLPLRQTPALRNFDMACDTFTVFLIDNCNVRKILQPFRVKSSSSFLTTVCLVASKPHLAGKSRMGNYSPIPPSIMYSLIDCKTTKNKESLSS